MRIKRLAIAGFGPYKEEQRVDFEGFRDDGLFLITGKTGAGKSSILDAICYALYGSIPRYDTTQQKLRSDYCTADDPSYVELEFAVGDVDYRVRRTPEYERPKARGTGTTTQKTTAELFRFADGVWEGMSARPVDVGHDLDRILGLSKEQFLQVILLAQNRFQQFLLAKNEERQSVLRNLFGTSRFEQMESVLVERRKALEAELGTARERLEQQAVQAAALVHRDPPESPDLEWFDSALAALDEERVQAAVAATTADATFTAADAAHRDLADVQKRQIRRDSAAEKLVALNADSAAIDGNRDSVNAANRAALVWSQVKTRREAASALATAASALDDARDAYAPYADDSEGDSEAASDSVSSAALKSTIGRVTKKLGTLEFVVAEEARLPAFVAEIGDLKERLEGAESAVTAATERIESLPEQIDGVGVRLSAAQIRAAGETEANLKVDRLAAARKSAATAAKLEKQHAEALRAATDASGLNATATALVHSLMQQRLNGHAAELAAELVDGEACSVCGSTAHPAPAEPNAEPVTDDDIERARLAADEAKAVADDAHGETQRIATRFTESRTAAGKKSVETLDEELDAAHATQADVRAAGEEATTLEADQVRLRAELKVAQESLSQLRSAHDDVSKLLAVSQAEFSALDERVARHRGEFSSVSEHVAALQAELEAANRLAEASGGKLSAEKTLADAGETLNTQLEEHGFADEDDAVEAKLPAAEITGLENRIRQHDQAVSTSQSTLAEPDLAELPDASVELDASREALAEARSARDLALATESSLRERQSQLARVVTSVRTQLTASARLHDEYRQLRELASAMQGNEPNTKRMRLETYVLAAQLEEIVAAANVRLRSMTSGRYTLEHDDSLQFRGAKSGLGLAILDQHTGRARATHSLSGGETFLASLALALGLAEVVTNQAGGITLDTLFIDEGFGSLDSDTLEIAMGTLDSLRSGGRTIGLISHVDAMKEQIPAHLRITVTDQGHSEIAEAGALV
ncbi:AAA family ATPase [Glaciibacter superstes]|uniref:AAA family ATPase n=1 Tax=Glaciibacter superstes TaxID=501023 RepID=UPI0003B33CFC|nr:SMC family ATPase [Glaciibacter superstes]